MNRAIEQLNKELEREKFLRERSELYKRLAIDGDGISVMTVLKAGMIGFILLLCLAVGLGFTFMNLIR